MRGASGCHSMTKHELGHACHQGRGFLYVTRKGVLLYNVMPTGKQGNRGFKGATVPG